MIRSEIVKEVQVLLERYTDPVAIAHKLFVDVSLVQEIIKQLLT